MSTEAPILESNNSSSPTEDTSLNSRPLTRHYLVHKLSASAPVFNQQPADVEDHKSDGGADQNYQFYKEYCRLYYANIILTNRLQ
jgi:hypothetical protein